MSFDGEPGQSTVEPELQGRTPRRVRYTRGTQGVRLFLWLLSLGVVGLIAHFGAKDVGQLKTLQAHGEAATGHITGHHASHGKHDTYYLDYAFMTENGVLSDDEDVSHAKYSETADGMPLTITYLPADPDIHRVGVVDDRYIQHSIRLWLIGAGSAALLLGLLLFLMEKRFRGERALLADGVAVTGRITNRYMVEGSKSNSYYVQYEFDGPHGTVAGKISVSKSLYDRANPGTAASILYNPAKPDDNRPYYVLTEDLRLA